LAKTFCSEKAIRFLKDAQIIFGGMGYETAESRQARGEPGFPIEQLVRDAEMYRIGEGATDILRPFVAREALSPHLERARVYLEGGLIRAGRTGSRRSARTSSRSPPRPCMPRRFTARTGTATSGTSPTNSSVRPSRA